MNKLLIWLLNALQWRTYYWYEWLSSALESKLSVADIKHLKKVLPYLADTKALFHCKEELAYAFTDYCTHYSDKVHVLSLEQAAFILNACREFAPQRVVDFGSGFSSFVLRKYVRENPKTMIWSVDDNDVWLKKTKQFLEENDLSTERLIHSKDFFSEFSDSNFDFIFYDLGNMQTRLEFFVPVLKLLDRQGSLMIDDVHKQDYRSYVVKVLKEQGIPYYNLKNITLDEYGRYAFAVIGDRNIYRAT